MRKTTKFIGIILSALFLISSISGYTPVFAAAKASTLKPQILMVTPPKAQYEVGERVSLQVKAPNYKGKVQYRVILWDGNKKAQRELWPKMPGYYYTGWVPAGTATFTIGWPIFEPGTYSLTVLVKRSGAKVSYDSYVKTISFVIKAKETSSDNGSIQTGSDNSSNTNNQSNTGSTNTGSSSTAGQGEQNNSGNTSNTGSGSTGSTGTGSTVGTGNTGNTGSTGNSGSAVVVPPAVTPPTTGNTTPVEALDFEYVGVLLSNGTVIAAQKQEGTSTYYVDLSSYGQGIGVKTRIASTINCKVTYYGYDNDLIAHTPRDLGPADFGMVDNDPPGVSITSMQGYADRNGLVSDNIVLKDSSNRTVVITLTMKVK